MFLKNKLILSALALSALSVQAQVTVGPIFGDHMVLQRDMEVPVWGKADPGEKVTVSFAGQTLTAEAAVNGKWQVKLAPMKVSAEGRDMVVKGTGNTITIKNILVGEVWLCSGQSNMEMPMWTGNPRWRATDGDKHVKAGANPLIRIAQQKSHYWTQLPDDDHQFTWQVLDEKNGLTFSATAFYFGQEIFKALNIPVGLVGSYWSGSRIDPWIPPCGFDSVPELKDLAYEVNAKLPGTEVDKDLAAKTAAEYTKWLEEFKAASAAGKLLPPPPAYRPEMRPYDYYQQSTVMYNKMIYPLVPFAFRGAIWYQGCSNLHDGSLYKYKMQALLNGWREVFQNPDFAFYFVQLAPYNYGGDPLRLPVIWETQEDFAKKEGDNIGMAVICDVGDYNDIHPHDKLTVGKRLALQALKNTYDQKDLKADSPLLQDWKFENGKFYLNFKFVEKWVAKGEVVNFEIAGPAGRWKRAKLEINGKQLIVSCPEVVNPTQLRYLWHHTVTGNLFNEAGLPLGAFRCERAATKEEIMKDVKESNQLVYKFDLKYTCPKDGSIKYEIDNSDKISGKVQGVTYVVELVDKNNNEQWAVISMDAFTDNVKKIGVPVKNSGAYFARRVQKLQMLTNVPGVKTGFIGEGNIEFWSSNYTQENSSKVPGASDSRYDFGDKGSSANVGYGSMQIHNYRDKQTLFAYNNFINPTPDLGIGNSPNGQPDWTFTKSGPNYTKAVLTVYAEIAK